MSFRDLFLMQEDDEEESASLGEALDALAGKWPDGAIFSAAAVSRVINDQSEYVPDFERQASASLREFFFPILPPNQTATVKATGKRMKKHLGEPVRRGERTLTLKADKDQTTNDLRYRVMVR